MKKITLGLLLAACVAFAPRAFAEPLPYTEGTVWELTMVRVKPGLGEDYLRSLGTTWKKVLDEAKKQKLIVSYKVLGSERSNNDDWDLLLMVEYKNMAAFDGLEEKMRAIELPALGGEQAAKQLMIKRLDAREIFGTKLARELILK